MTRIVPVLIAIVAGAGLGCSGYHYVRSSDLGGTIALDGSRDSAMGKAKDAMESHCRYGYEIVSQGEEMVPVDEYSDPDYSNSIQASGGPTLRSEYKNEYRITYVCRAPASASQAPR